MEGMKKAFSLAGALLSSFLGILYIPVAAMVCANAIDYITGIMCAAYKGEGISARKGMKGIIKKIGMWVLVIVGILLDRTVSYVASVSGTELPFSNLTGCFVCIWVVCNELISILENVHGMDVAIPKFLEPMIEALKGKAEDGMDS